MQMKSPESTPPPDQYIYGPNQQNQPNNQNEQNEQNKQNQQNQQIEEKTIRRPMIALTFDDGPSSHTEHILDLLEQHGGRATFFVLGYRAERQKHTIKRATELGSEIANHTWSHARLTELDNESITQELTRTSQIIEQIVGHNPPIMRPPFGSTCPRVREVAGDLGYAVINWTLDTSDWRYRDPNRIYNTIMNEVEDGSVILMHDIHPTTAQAMIRVIPRLIYEGYELVTVSELLTYFYGELEPGRLYGRSYESDED